MIKKRIKFLFITVIIAFITSIFVVHQVAKKLGPIIQSYSAIEAQRFGGFIINSAIDKEFINSLDQDIFITKKNSNNEIEMIDFKTKEVNVLLEMVTKKVQDKLLALENGNIDNLELADTFYGLEFKDIKKGVVCEIPTGVVLPNSILANNGPTIPVKLSFIGEVVANLKTTAKTYGINSVYLEVSIHVEVRERVTMPLRTKEVTTDVDIPLTIKIIQGTIPDYYQNQILKDSSLFSLPVE